jgi:hypothetical protein
VLQFQRTERTFNLGQSDMFASMATINRTKSN